MTLRALSPFLLISFGIAWGIIALYGTPQSEWSFMPFLIGAVAISVIVTPLFNTSGGSILLPALFHLQLINPLWPDAQPHDTYLFVGVAVLVVWLNRETMFRRAGAVTDVVPAATP